MNIVTINYLSNEDNFIIIIVMLFFSSSLQMRRLCSGGPERMTPMMSICYFLWPARSHWSGSPSS